jgi:hypothetical protein
VRLDLTKHNRNKQANDEQVDPILNPVPLVAAPPRAEAELDLPVLLDRELWHDEDVMTYLRNGTYPDGASTKVIKDRIWHRAQGYHYDKGVLKKSTASGTIRIVPKPEQRANLIHRVHQDVGHFGVKKTYSLLEPTYWWVGMFRQVQQEVAACVVCDRIKATFEVKDPTLKPLPIMGMFYRWGVDLCKIPTISKTGGKHIVVMIEHFSKWIELRAIPEKTSEYTAAALTEVLTHYGAPAEILTDQGDEFQGEFAELLESLLIDHCETSLFRLCLVKSNRTLDSYL